jgi:hypothetical protein
MECGGKPVAIGTANEVENVLPGDTRPAVAPEQECGTRGALEHGPGGIDDKNSLGDGFHEGMIQLFPFPEISVLGIPVQSKFDGRVEFARFDRFEKEPRGFGAFCPVEGCLIGIRSGEDHGRTCPFADGAGGFNPVHWPAQSDIHENEIRAYAIRGFDSILSAVGDAGNPVPERFASPAQVLGYDQAVLDDQNVHVPSRVGAAW